MKWFLRATLAVFFLLTASLCILRFSPSTLLWVASWGSDLDIDARSISLRYFPPQLDLRELSVLADQQPLVKFEELELSSSWAQLLTGTSSRVSVRARNGSINLHQLPGSNKPSSTRPSQNVEALNLYQLATAGRLDAENITFNLDENSSIQFRELSNALNTADKTLETLIQAQYSIGEVVIPINAVGELKRVDSNNQLTIQLAKLDLVKLMQRQSESLDEKGGSTELNWAWLSQLAGTKLNLELDELVLPNGSASDFQTSVTLTDRVVAKSNALVRFDVSDTQNLEERIQLNLDFKPIRKAGKHADIQGLFSVQIKWLSLAGKGEINLSDLNHTVLDFNVNIQALPPELNAAPELSKQYLPLTASAQLIGTESELLLQNLSATMGNSDLAGSINLNIEPDNSTPIEFDLSSNRFDYQPSTKPEVEPEVNTPPPDTPFLDIEPLDWSWLSAANIEGQLAIKRLTVGLSQLDQLAMPIKLTEQKLSINAATAKLNQGNIGLSAQIAALDNGASTSLELEFDQVDMSKSGIFAEGQIKGGLANGRMQIDSNGASVRDLAKQANGYIYANIGPGEIAQGSLDVLGSDLILGTLSKLNPFAKSDPFTKLECGVINLRVDGGVISAKNSIAVETSKVAIVGTGKVNLNNEKIDLRFNPKAKKSLGVNLSSLAKAVKLGGTLNKPAPSLSGLGLAQTGLSVGAAVSTGGLSLLAEGLMDDFTADSACRNARAAYQQSAEE